MNIKNYLSEYKHSLVHGLKKLKKKLRSIVIIDFRSKKDPDTLKMRNEDNATKTPILENHSIINRSSKISLPSQRTKDNKVSTGSSETEKETEMHSKKSSIPSGSRVLSISLSKGKITKKVYLTPDGQKISFKGDEL